MAIVHVGVVLDPSFVNLGKVDGENAVEFLDYRAGAWVRAK